MRERIVRELREAAERSRQARAGCELRDRLRDCDQHDRRLLPVAAPRVSARGRPRSGLRGGRRDRGAAPGGRGARSRASHHHRARGRRARHRARARAAGPLARAPGPGAPARAAARRLGRARSVPREGPAGSHRADGMPPGGGERCPGRARRAAGRARGLPRRRPRAPSAVPAAAPGSGAAAGSSAGQRSARCVRCSIAWRRTSSRRGRPAQGGRHPPVQHRGSLPVGRRGPSPSAAVFAAAPEVAAGACRCSRATSTCVLARGPADVRHRAHAVPPCARRAVGARLLRRPRARPGAAAQMDEFSQSRFRLESRYHHVLVDEFQDTSRAQWELVSLLVQAWGEGEGLVAILPPPTRLRRRRPQAVDLPVPRRGGRGAARGRALHRGPAPRRPREARDQPELPRAAGTARASSTTCSARWPHQKGARRTSRYTETDRFPPPDVPAPFRGTVLGVAVAEEPEACARAVAAEIVRVLAEENVRDRGRA
jgi:hypothetical protein